ncbi:hypothetical protein ASPZODRAFT_132553 [Penicilliopsis zonata CBS 506.65]|uniref:Monopolin complex subunit Csm1/Pcs1 C-terminal domain-containing protein n=1 Tax=Penicilliopsis zonata CBS 506.65 TaxID=1073090 RepID=A0A1L9SHA9_9EURO|nr:hypothetical protein ASPZODRAFT_132553 [Penicilliopsis zonata CBS 506.65]OJJ46483.1 hypothetical protein ASPZODRAFT_132553 [Penicilliopsis zonata CBS 506.65]
MPKRKAAAAKLTGLAGSDDEDSLIPAVEKAREEPPAKKRRGRPRSLSSSKGAEIMANMKGGARAATAEAAPRRTTRGRPKGQRVSTDSHEAEVGEGKDSDKEAEGAVEETSKPSRSRKPAATRGKRKVSEVKQVQNDGEFEYTPGRSRPIASSDVAALKKSEEGPKKKRGKVNIAEVEETIPETQVIPEVDETVLAEEPARARSVTASPTKAGYDRRVSRALQESPRKGNANGVHKGQTEPELRRKIGELNKKCETLETRYRNLKEIGIVEANANMDKLRKQMDLLKSASSDLVESLEAELEEQRAINKQTRALQKQLKDRDSDVARLESHSEDLSAKLTSAWAEVKALQTKLAAARNTAASLETVAAKVPGSAIKNTAANRAHAAATAEAAQMAQFAQLKEDLYSDLTGLIIRDVKKRESDHLYDCIQTGHNGTLHFKLAVPQVPAGEFQSAKFHYVPLLDESRDRDLLELLPDYLAEDIEFARSQAANFYTRVIEVLTKRRASLG